MRWISRITKTICKAVILATLSVGILANADSVIELKRIYTLQTTLPATVQVLAKEGRGSGFYLNYRGKTFIITNNHITGNNSKVRILHTDGSEVVGHVIATSPKLDLSVITTKNIQERKEYLKLLEESVIPFDGLAVGQKVFNIGYSLPVPYMMREAIIIAFLDGDIMLNSNIYFGDSGGPLMDMNGYVVGVIYKGYPKVPSNGAAIHYILLKDYLDKIIKEN